VRCIATALDWFFDAWSKSSWNSLFVQKERKFHRNESSRERKFLERSLPRNESSTGANVPRKESSTGTKVPSVDFSLPGTKVPRHEKYVIHGS